MAASLCQVHDSCSLNRWMHAKMLDHDTTLGPVQASVSCAEVLQAAQLQTSNAALSHADFVWHVQGKMDINTYTDKLAEQIQGLPNQMSKLLDSATEHAQQAQKSLESGKESGSKSAAGSQKK